MRNVPEAKLEEGKSSAKNAEQYELEPSNTINPPSDELNTTALPNDSQNTWRTSFIDHLKELTSNSLSQIENLSQQILFGKEKKRENSPLLKAIYDSNLAHANADTFLKDNCPELKKERTLLTLASSLQYFATPICLGQFVNSLQSNSNFSLLWGTLVVLMPSMIKQVDIRLNYIAERMGDHCLFGERAALVKQFYNLEYNDTINSEISNQLESARSNPFRTKEFIDAKFERLANRAILTGALAGMLQINPTLAVIVGCGIIPLMRIEKRKSSFAEKVRNSCIKMHKKLWPSFFDLTDTNIIPQIKTMVKANWGMERIKSLSDEIIGVYKKLCDGVYLSNLAASKVNAITTTAAGGWMIYQAIQGAIPAGNAIQFMGVLGGLQFALNRDMDPKF